MIADVTIPEISENVESGKVVSVLVAVGDRVEADDVLIELETEKAVVEIPSTAGGKIVELLAAEGEEKKVGDVIARIDTAAADADSGEDTGKAEPVAEEATREEETAPREAVTPPDRTDTTEKTLQDDAQETSEPAKAADREEAAKDRRKPAPASPSIRRLARELGVNIYDVAPSGPGGRITESDVKAYVQTHLPGGGPAAPRAAGEPELPDFSRWGDVEVDELPTVRRITAESTATSWHTVPHVTQFDRADITHLQAFIDKNADTVSRKGGKLTLTAVLTRVCAEALKRFPGFNASIDMAGRRIIYKRYRHIGIAVDTSRGLLVPVVRNADEKRITELAVEIADLAERARNKKIKPDEMEGGTFTVSNQGGIGGTNFTPVVLWPQAAILGVSRATVEPVHFNGAFEPRTLLPLSLSYDHRIIDGADAARFMRWVCNSLEHPLTMLL